MHNLFLYTLKLVYSKSASKLCHSHHLCKIYNSFLLSCHALIKIACLVESEHQKYKPAFQKPSLWFILSETCSANSWKGVIFGTRKRIIFQDMYMYGLFMDWVPMFPYHEFKPLMLCLYTKLLYINLDQFLTEFFMRMMVFFLYHSQTKSVDWLSPGNHNWSVISGNWNHLDKILKLLAVPNCSKYIITSNRL